MKVLVADDDPVSRHLLGLSLTRWGYEVTPAEDGEQAWTCLQQTDGPRLAVLDWMMPALSGPEICGRVRGLPTQARFHLILLTARNALDDVISGLNAGADDYITKPFDLEELRARVKVGERIITLQNNLADRVEELEAALNQVRQLQGLLPICLYCKKIRNDQNYWQQLEGYLMRHSDVRFSHGICPDCYERVVRPQLDQAPAPDAPPG